MKKFKVGYTQGTYDLFHVGHLNLLENAKECCDYLIVGINSDRLVQEYKNKTPIIKEQDRMRIASAIKVVDQVVLCDSLDKEEAYLKHHFDVIFIGDDWKGNERWKNTEETLKKYNVPVWYLPHTPGISTSILNKKISGKES